MQIFYVPQIDGSEIFLDQTESRHSVKVLRLAQGELVQVVDGEGGFYEARIEDANPKKCKLSVVSATKEFGKSNFRLHIAIAPTKNNERLEWFLEKATEIGIDEITPILCEHSERKSIKPERLEKITIAAMKQSLKAYLPKLNMLTPFSSFISSVEAQKKFIAHCNEGNKIHLKDDIKKGEDLLVLIGPEGDFSVEEVALAKKRNFTEITLGPSRLRTETAGVAACLIANLANL